MGDGPFSLFAKTTPKVTAFTSTVAYAQILPANRNRLVLRFFNSGAVSGMFLRATEGAQSGDHLDFNTSMMDVRFTWWDDGPLVTLGWSLRAPTPFVLTVFEVLYTG